MKFIVENWLLLIILFAVLAVVGYSISVFLHRPTTEQISKVKEWLLYAVSAAEKELGSGTGQVKLRYVYDMFIARFPYMARVIPFDTFSVLVDEALDKFKNMLENNQNLQNYIGGNN